MPVKTNLAITIQNRKAFKKLMDGLNIDQINHIPHGFKNNIFWNCAHVIAVQQMLTYQLIDHPFSVQEEFVYNFAPGTRPNRIYDVNDVIELKSGLFTSMEQLKSDIESGLFDKPFKPFITALKFEVNDIASAVAFNQYHEALHMGYVLNLMKFN